MLCHGGSGKTLAALSAGLPLVIVPQGADHLEHAREIAAMPTAFEATAVVESLG